MKLILASNSPRRKELLQNNGIKFKVVSSNYKEQQFSSDPIITAKEFAYGKAKDVFESLADKDNVVVLGADTVVYHNGKILGKANSDSQAEQMLKSLSGKSHEVITGYALISKDKTVIDCDKSIVKFNVLSENLISEYIVSGLYKGKAGSYGIQDRFPLVERFIGSYDNIVGLPTEKVLFELEKFTRSKNE